MDEFDRLVLLIIGGLVAAIGLVVAVGDHIGVAILSRYPDDNGSPPITASIEITFAQSVNQESVEERFYLDPPVEGTFSWLNTTMVFKPIRPLSADITYLAVLEAGIESSLGRVKKSSFTWSFTPRRPRIAFLAPADVEIRSLWIAESGTGDIVEIVATEYGIADFAPSPDGKSFALSVYDSERSISLWLAKTDGSNLRKILDCAPGFCVSPAWSPDGAILAFQRQQPGPAGGLGPSRIWVYDMASAQYGSLMQDNQVLGFAPAWSPTGDKIAFFDANATGIRVLSVAPESARSIILPTQMGEVGTFSSDGQSMVYPDLQQIGRQYYTQLWVADLGGNADDSVIPLVTDNLNEQQWPSYSPGGDYLAYGERRLDRQEGRGHQLWLLDLRSGKRRQVTNDPEYNNLAFVWSPDAKWIVFRRFNLEVNYPQSELWLYDVQNNELRLLVENAGDGKWLP